MSNTEDQERRGDDRRGGEESADDFVAESSFEQGADDFVAESLEEADKVEQRQKRTMRLLSGVAMAGLVASVAYSLQFELSMFPSVLATAIILASGSAMAGGLLGFLFGLPRGRRAESQPLRQSSAQSPATAIPSNGTLNTGREAATRPNTNLEDISDWLTKILVGVGLTQLAAIGDALGRLANAVAPSLGGADSSAAFGLALVLTFALTGFLVGYLWTRFYIPAAFERAESDVRDELRELREDTASNFTALARKAATLPEQVQKQVEQTMQQPEVSTPQRAVDRARDFAEEYDRARRSLPSGPARTFEMSRIVSSVRASAAELVLSEEDIRKLFKESEGGRIVALTLIAATHNAGFADLVREAILRPASAFEQYQALQAAKALVEASDLSLADRRELGAAIEEQMKPGRYITRQTDRWPVAQAILRRL
jgi:hypothetical protein